jgi:hypothetical protein
MIMIDIKFGGGTLDNQPRFVRREYRTSAVEFFNIQRTGLRTRRGDSDLWDARMSIILQDGIGDANEL